MNLPSRGERESAATMRYWGCFFLPMRVRRNLTAMTNVSWGKCGTCSMLSAPRPLRHRSTKLWRQATTIEWVTTAAKWVLATAQEFVEACGIATTKATKGVAPMPATGLAVAASTAHATTHLLHHLLHLGELLHQTIHLGDRCTRTRCDS